MSVTSRTRSVSKAAKKCLYCGAIEGQSCNDEKIQLEKENAILKEKFDNLSTEFDKLNEKSKQQENEIELMKTQQGTSISSRLITCS